VRAAGVLGEIAADGADLLTAGVGCEVVAAPGGRLRDVEVDDAGLDHGPLVLPADLADGTHP
jgi:hypothetical protein